MNRAFECLGVHAVYHAWDIPGHQLEALFPLLKHIRPLGMNVTAPHKIAVVRHLERLTAEACAVGAVNCIRMQEGLWLGHNTDIEGFEGQMTGSFDAQTLADLRSESPLILGGGGAALAVIAALGRLGFTRISVALRSSHRASMLRAMAQTARVELEIVDWALRQRAAGEARLIVQATPLSLDFQLFKQLLDMTLLPAHCLFVDINYGHSHCVQWAQSLNLFAVDGIKMLTHQAAASLRFWMGLEVCAEWLTDVVRGALHEG